MGVVEFEFGGRLSLDLTWTLRYRAVHPTELLAGSRDLVDWLRAAGLPSAATATPADLVAAVSLREAIFRSASAVIDGAPVASADREVINRWAGEVPPAPVLRRDGMRGVAVIKGQEVNAALSEVARDAVDLLTAGDGRLRRCEGPRCSLLFHDTSRPGSRRWCSTTRCGNKVNTKAYRRRVTGRDVAGS